MHVFLYVCVFVSGDVLYELLARNCGEIEELLLELIQSVCERRGERAIASVGLCLVFSFYLEIQLLQNTRSLNLGELTNAGGALVCTSLYYSCCGDIHLHSTGILWGFTHKKRSPHDVSKCKT